MSRVRTLWRGWPLERALFVVAGIITLAGALLAALVSPWFILLLALVGMNQVIYAVAGACPASVVLRRACGLHPGGGT